MATCFFKTNKQTKNSSVPVSYFESKVTAALTSTHSGSHTVQAGKESDVPLWGTDSSKLKTAGLPNSLYLRHENKAPPPTKKEKKKLLAVLFINWTSRKLGELNRSSESTLWSCSQGTKREMGKLIVGQLPVCLNRRLNQLNPTRSKTRTRRDLPLQLAAIYSLVDARGWRGGATQGGKSSRSCPLDHWLLLRFLTLTSRNRLSSPAQGIAICGSPPFPRHANPRLIRPIKLYLPGCLPFSF